MPEQRIVRRARPWVYGAIIGAWATLGASIIGCSAKTGSFFYGALNAGEPRLAITSGVAGTYVVNLYDLEGKLQRVMTDYTADNLVPRGIAPLDYFNFLVALDGTDQIGVLNLMGEKSSFVVNANLTGNLYQLRRSSNGNIFVIENNTIEGFDSSGARIGNPAIGTTIGSCTLNTPRGLAIDANGRIIAVGTGNDDITIYSISGTTASCFAANTSLAGTVDPFAVVAHSNGYLYVATQGDDRIYRFNGNGSGTGTVVFNNTAVINNPTAIVELPDGTMLVASDGTNSIEQIDASGNRVGSTSFILDGFTGSVTDMTIIPGDL